MGGLENRRARRFCGVLYLDVLEVNHQKDGFAWDLFSEEDLLKVYKIKLVEDFLEEAKKKVGKSNKENKL